MYGRWTILLAVAVAGYSAAALADPSTFRLPPTAQLSPLPDPGPTVASPLGPRRVDQPGLRANLGPTDIARGSKLSIIGGRDSAYRNNPLDDIDDARRPLSRDFFAGMKLDIPLN
jgi:hypothetical protein